MSTARIVLLIALALGAASRPSTAEDADSSTRHQAPPEPPLLVPWKAGQWATYELKVPKGTWTVNLIVVAEDTCGFWLDIEVLEGGDHRTDTRLCVARTPTQAATDPPSRVKFEVFGRDSNFTKAEDVDEPLDARKIADTVSVFDGSWSGQRGLKREDVTTPAGTFIAALAQTPAGVQRWSHPAVPITGIVRQVDAASTLVLTSFGLTRTTSALKDEARAIVGLSRGMNMLARPRKLWMMYQLGSGYFGTLDSSSSTTSLGFSMGFRFWTSLAVVAGSMNVSPVPYAPKPELSEDLLLVHAGLRWYPYAEAKGRWGLLQRGIYLQGDLGFAQVNRGDMDSSSVVGRGAFGGARLGIATSIVQDWKLAAEFTAQGALLNGDEGTRINLGLIAVIELYFPSLW